jgi:hypothetical protein
MRALKPLPLFAAGLAAALLVAELLLRVLPTPTASMTGYALDPRILTYPPHHQWQVATGWDLRNPQRMVSNNLGFSTAAAFTRDASAVGLVGDSFVETSMLDAADRPAAQLERALGGRRVVRSLGLPGSSLMDYGQRIRWAQRELGIRDFIVLVESSDLRASYCGSGNTHSPCLDRVTMAYREQPVAEATWVKRLARHSALAQYVVGQLRFDTQRLWRQAFSRSVPLEPGAQSAAAAAAAPPIQPRLAFASAVTDRFFADIEGLDIGRLVFIVSGGTTVAHTAHAGERLELEAERVHFMALARARGAQVVDLEPLYAEYLGRSRHAIVVAPEDRHLNRLGVAIAVQAALPSIP